MTFKEIRNKYNHFVFIFGLGKMLELGTEKCIKLTDDDIENAYQKEIERQKDSNEICIYTPEVIRDMFFCARELAHIEMTELFNGITNAELFDNHQRPIKYDRLNELLGAAVQNLDEYGQEDFKADAMLEPDEAEYISEDLYNRLFGEE